MGAAGIIADLLKGQNDIVARASDGEVTKADIAKYLEEQTGIKFKESEIQKGGGGILDI